MFSGAIFLHIFNILLSKSRIFQINYTHSEHLISQINPSLSSACTTQLSDMSTCFFINSSNLSDWSDYRPSSMDAMLNFFKKMLASFIDHKSSLHFWLNCDLSELIINHGNHRNQMNQSSDNVKSAQSQMAYRYILRISV